MNASRTSRGLSGDMALATKHIAAAVSLSLGLHTGVMLALSNRDVAPRATLGPSRLVAIRIVSPPAKPPATRRNDETKVARASSSPQLPKKEKVPERTKPRPKNRKPPQPRKPKSSPAPSLSTSPSASFEKEAVSTASPTTGGNGVEKPHAITHAALDRASFQMPEYTRAAARAEYEAEVLVEVLVSPSGKVLDTKFESEVLYGMDRQIARALRRSRFEPARNPAGVPLKAWTTVKFRLVMAR